MITGSWYANRTTFTSRPLKTQVKSQWYSENLESPSTLIEQVSHHFLSVNYTNKSPSMATTTMPEHANSRTSISRFEHGKNIGKPLYFNVRY